MKKKNLYIAFFVVKIHSSSPNDVKSWKFISISTGETFHSKLFSWVSFKFRNILEICAQKHITTYFPGKTNISEGGRPRMNLFLIQNTFYLHFPCDSEVIS